MKRIITISILLLAVIVTVNADRRRLLMTRNVVAAGASWSAVTSDLWETFEFTDPPDATKLGNADSYSGETWGVGNSPTINVSANYSNPFNVNSTSDSGTRGIIMDINGAANIYADLNSYPTTQSVGFWMYVSTLDASSYVRVYGLGESAPMTFGAANHVAFLCVDRDSGSGYTAALWTGARAAQSSTITVSAATWYWVTVKIINNSTCSLRVYDTTSAQVGSEVTVTGLNKNTYYHTFGTGTSTTGELRIDNFVIDKTSAVFPLAK